MGHSKRSAAATKFLNEYNCNGPWVLTTIGIDNGNIETRTFDDAEEMSQWIAENIGKKNVYFHANSVMHHLNKKAKRTDIKTVDYLYVDIDPEEGKDLKEEQKRILELLTDKRPECVPEPTFIVFSGGGYQAFWKLSTPIEINGNLEAAELAKLYNLRLEKLFNADNCHNIDRIMRLPGTENIPDKKKSAKGRVRTMAKVIDFNGKNYDLKLFTPAAVTTPPMANLNIKVDISNNIKPVEELSTLDEWNVPNRIKVIIAQGIHSDQPKEGDNSRSAWLFDCVCGLVRSKVPDNIIFSIITDARWAISESVRRQMI